jgi:tripartite-type tricarboxylate transporter receptor subunit TctC
MFSFSAKTVVCPLYFAIHPSRLKMIRYRAVAVALLSMSAFVAPAGAQGYPAKPVRVIVPFTPGGAIDLIGRMIGQRLSERLNTPFVIENRPGGGTNIGAEVAARSAPDGYTLFMASTSQAVNVTLYPKLTYDLFKDFAPVTLVAINPNVLVVHPSLPVKNVKELIALAKRKPGALTYASSGSGTSSHLAAELLKLLAGVDMVHVPYKGAGPAITALLGGQVDLFITNAAAASAHIKTGKLRALAVTTEHRLPGMPGVPTMQEAGVPGYEVSAWTGLLAPAGTRPEIITLLNKETREAINDVSKRLEEVDAIPRPTTPEEFTGFLRNEVSKWGPVVKRSGARVE